MAETYPNRIYRSWTLATRTWWRPSSSSPRGRSARHALSARRSRIKLVAWHQAHRGELDPDQAWFWTEEWQSGEREASQQMEAGQGVTYATGEDFLASLSEPTNPAK